VVTQFQLKRMSGTDGALTLRVAQALVFGLHIQRQHVIHPFVEQRNGQAGAFLS
jgi:hypothetical protein